MDSELVDGRSGPGTSTVSDGLDPRRWKALALLSVAFLMIILDGTIVLTAIPSMKEELGFSTSGVQWVLTAYALTFGGLMLFGGRLADLLGRRRVFMTGLVLFVAASLLCGLAWSGGVLVGARALQGTAAAFLGPSALAIVMTTFPEGPERNTALGIWGGIGGIGATAGLLVGGSVTSGLGWEWIFFINVPVGLVALALSPVLLRESSDRRRPRAFDPGGAVTITAALVLVVYAVVKAPRTGWTDGVTVGLLLAAAVLFVLFVVIETRTAEPLLPLPILRSRMVVGGNVAIFAVGMTVDGVLFVLTLYAQQVLGYSAIQFGLMTAVMTGMAIVGALTGQAVVTRIGLRPVMVCGMVLLGSGCLLLTRVSADGGYVDDLLAAMLVFGPGLGAAFVAAQIAALTGVREQDSGLASGLVDTAFRIGAALGTAVASTVAVSRTQEVLARADSTLPTGPALTEGFRAAFAVTAVIALVGLVAALVLPGARKADADS
ncbi:MFS transporter [Virgisporangium ochraceum]|uniref:MFS transporter n=1 Tax=Virgisporangium ochraceum TaxID=65505 RepID=A0A8J3ZXD4_9ACTN|nr:MFS transporter [Virgisporangium ochraceum]GIJ70672.1 MFS transporter [Virgisporangium ochraceum]